jgi:probable HAF family extracellular repeat protein
LDARTFVLVGLALSVAAAPIQGSNIAAPSVFAVQGLGAGDNRITISRDINNSGQVVGLTFGPSSFAKVYSRNHIATLSPLAGLPGSDVSAINNKGVIVGDSNVRVLAGIHRTRACEWVGGNGTVTDLGCLPGKGQSRVIDVNNGGDVVGYCFGAGKERAFLWRKENLYDLNLLVPKRSGWALEIAWAINDRGQIVGHGTYRGKDCAFLLTPRPSSTRIRASQLSQVHIE